jgi:hypothetical protein
MVTTKTTSRHNRIKSFDLCDDFKISATFQNGENKTYSLKPLLNRNIFSVFATNPAFFNNATLSHGGLAITWSDEVDIASDEIYYNGVEVEAPHNA